MYTMIIAEIRDYNGHDMSGETKTHYFVYKCWKKTRWKKDLQESQE